MTKVLKKRHFAKAFTWRLVATLFTFILAFIFTNNIKLSLVFGSIDFGGKFFLYYFHERFWYNKMKFGVKQ